MYISVERKICHNIIKVHTKWTQMVEAMAGDNKAVRIEARRFTLWLSSNAWPLMCLTFLSGLSTITPVFWFMPAHTHKMQQWKYSLNSLSHHKYKNWVNGEESDKKGIWSMKRDNFGGNLFYVWRDASVDKLTGGKVMSWEFPFTFSISVGFYIPITVFLDAVLSLPLI